MKIMPLIIFMVSFTFDAKRVSGKDAEVPLIAIAYFDNASGQPIDEPLTKGLSLMLISDLKGLSAIRVVERSQINAVIDEIKFQSSPYVDKTTAIKIGKHLGARYLLAGSFYVQLDEMRVDIRLVDVETSEIIMTQTVAGKRHEVFAIEKELVMKLVSQLSIAVSQSEKRRLRQHDTLSYEAAIHYFRGIDADDRGNQIEAKKEYIKAIALDSGYQTAKSAAERLDLLSKAMENKTKLEIEQMISNLDPSSSDFAVTAQNTIIKISSEEIENTSLMKRLKIAQLLINSGKKLPVSSYETGNLMILYMWYKDDPVIGRAYPYIVEAMIRKYANEKPENIGYSADFLKNVAHRGQDLAKVDGIIKLKNNAIESGKPIHYTSTFTAESCREKEINEIYKEEISRLAKSLVDPTAILSYVQKAENYAAESCFSLLAHNTTSSELANIIYAIRRGIVTSCIDTIINQTIVSACWRRHFELEQLESDCKIKPCTDIARHIELSGQYREQFEKLSMWDLQRDYMRPWRSLNDDLEDLAKIASRKY